MKQFLFAILMVISTITKGQLTKDQHPLLTQTLTSSGTHVDSSTARGLYYSLNNTAIHTPPPIDTAKCLFLEILNIDSAIMKWTSGYVIVENGFITFGKKEQGDIGFYDYPIKVTKNYLPITVGIVSSKMLYNDKSEVKNEVIRIVMKPTEKIKSSVLY